MLHIDSYLLEEQEDSGQEVSKSLVINYFALYSLSDADPLELLHCLLVGSAVKRQLDVSNALELGVSFVLRIHEVLNLSHLELTHSHQTISRSNLVSESETNLRSCEGQTTSVEFEQLGKVNEHSLCSLGTKISN